MAEFVRKREWKEIHPRDMNSMPFDPLEPDRGLALAMHLDISAAAHYERERAAAAPPPPPPDPLSRPPLALQVQLARTALLTDSSSYIGP